MSIKNPNKGLSEIAQFLEETLKLKSSYSITAKIDEQRKDLIYVTWSFEKVPGIIKVEDKIEITYQFKFDSSQIIIEMRKQPFKGTPTDAGLIELFVACIKIKYKEMIPLLNDGKKGYENIAELIYRHRGGITGDIIGIL